jgi:hypothetical protein
MYFQYTRQKGNDYINFLLKEQFSPKNIFKKEELIVKGLEDFVEIKENSDEFEEENTDFEDIATSVRSKLKPIDIENYIKSLKSASVHWYNTYNPINNKDLTKEEQQWIEKLNRIGIAYFRPLITASFLNENIDSSQRVKLFQTIERFIFVAFRLGRALSSYRNSEFYRCARLLQTGEWSINQVIALLEVRLNFSFKESDDGKLWFDYEYFKKHIDKHFQNGGGFYWWNGLKYFLYEYEMELVQQRGSQKIDWDFFVKNDADKVSIEHILPQTPDKECWKSVLKGLKKKEIAILQGTLGNLVPLSRSINSSIQNDCFDDKKKAKLDDKGNKIRQGYCDGSHSEIKVSQYPQWRKEEILERGIDLLTFMERRWNLKFETTDKKILLLGMDFLN